MSGYGSSQQIHQSPDNYANLIAAVIYLPNARIGRHGPIFTTRNW